jgi:hypothetical protein
MAVSSKDMGRELKTDTTNVKEADLKLYSRLIKWYEKVFF